MKFLDKENIIVIVIALALLIAWGMWYPGHQAGVNAKIRQQQAEAQALEAQKTAAAA